ncbi:hypothetical protein ONZ45_g4343 [Pleurotus djamor]|nr:hypothetical protein ONZ45_g4343 [Pleurotus djamor]
MPQPLSGTLLTLFRLLQSNAFVKLLRRTPCILFNFLLRLNFLKNTTNYDPRTIHINGCKTNTDNVATTVRDLGQSPGNVCTSRAPGIPAHEEEDEGEEIPIRVEDPDGNSITESQERSDADHNPLRVQIPGPASSFRSRSPCLSGTSLPAPTIASSQSRISGSRHSVADSFASLASERLLNGSQASIRTSKIHPDIDCMLSIELSRYNRRHLIPQAAPNVVIAALETGYTTEDVPGWTRYIHPDGAPYWYHEEKKVLTDSNMLDSDALSKTEEFIRIIFDYIRAENIQLERDVELVVELVKYDDDDHPRCGYYFISHRTRCLFWLESFDLSERLWHAQAQTSLPHVKLEIEVSYWQHWEFFCNIQSATEDILNELTDILITSLVDSQTSTTSNSPFSADDLQLYLNAVKISRKLIGTNCRGSPWFIGRLMSMYKVESVRQRFANFHGEYGARLQRDQSVHNPDGHQRTLLIRIVAPFLFNAPDIHLRALHLIFPDGLASTPSWRAFIKKLNEEWQDFTINVCTQTINVLPFSFPFNLIIFDVDNNAQETPERSPSQIASYLSTLTSVSSVMVSLLLVRQNRTKGHDTAEAAADYLKSRYYRVVGHEPLAIMYSLPYAFLMWSILLFLIAFVLTCTLHTSLITQCFTGVTASLCISLILWCIWMNWDYAEGHDSRWNMLIGSLSALHESLRRFVPTRFPFARKQAPEEPTPMEPV